MRMMSISTGRTSRILLGLAGAFALGAIAWAGWIYLTTPQQVAAVTCGAAPPRDYVWVPGGRFAMGSEDHYPEEGPVREVSVEGFWLRSHEVTNNEFAAFVEATGYVTVAEREPPEGGAPGSAVFLPPEEGEAVRPMSWWHWVEGANWRHPEGPGSSISGKGDHPVTQIAYEDAEAFAAWAGETLPDEAQYEYAASAGGQVSDTPYVIEGETRRPIANTWQGVFPLFNSGADGFFSTSPAGCFDANPFGLYDMIGNVWEWTSTPADGAPGSGIIKGGSYLCAPNFCMRYRPAAREVEELNLGTNHIGFRTIRPGPPPDER